MFSACFVLPSQPRFGCADSIPGLPLYRSCGTAAACLLLILVVAIQSITDQKDNSQLTEGPRPRADDRSAALDLGIVAGLGREALRLPALPPTLPVDPGALVADRGA